MSEINFAKLAKSSAIGAGIGMLLSAAVTFIMAAILSIGNIPAMIIPPMAIFSLIFGGFCGGFSSAKILSQKGLLCGAVSGVIFFLVTWSLGGLFSIGDFGPATLIKAALIITAGAFGGIIGVNK